MIELLALSTPAWSGLSAILGALVGGAVTGIVTYKMEGSRQRFEQTQREKDREREDAATRTLTRGIARVMRTRYERLGSIIQASLDNGLWLPVEVEVEPPPPIEDRKLVAAVATVDEWLAIDVAEFSLALMLTARETIRAQRSPATGALLTWLEAIGDEQVRIAGTVSSLAKGKTALDRLAEIG